MRLAVFNLALLVLVALLAAANWFLAPDRARPNYEFLPQMAHAPRYNAFSANPNFADGKTLQPPPPGSIARGFMPLHYGAGPMEALRAGAELRSPIPLDDPRVIARGKEVFNTFCTPCHGMGARGDGLITRRGFPPPPSLVDENARRFKDGHIFQVISFGLNNMKPYGGLIPREDRWKVVAYVRLLQQQAAQADAAPAPTTPAEAASSTPAEPTRGGAR